LREIKDIGKTGMAPSIAAVVLAAGESTRMGTPKALLPDPDGRPFVARLARTFFAAGLDDVVVVTGARHADILTALADDGLPRTPIVVRNPAPSRGQLSSLWTGLDALDGRAYDAVLMTLVDVPMVRADTVRAVIDGWRASGAPIVRPAIGDRHGHPVLFSRAVVGELRRAPLDEGAKAVVHAHADQLVNVPVEDEGCLADVDTPADYRRLLARHPPRGT
jgi:molybdenum cofactor cytidylyltransferase